MKARFEPDGNPALKASPEATLVDPEAYDAGEQQFAASLEEKPARPKFVVDEPAEEFPEKPKAGDGSRQAEGAETVQPRSRSAGQSEMPERLTESPDQASDAWRQEVQAKITHYRARKRPCLPRYPSLQLKFESPEPSWDKSQTTRQFSAAALPNQGALATQEIAPVPRPEPAETGPRVPSFPAEETGKVLEFPRAPGPVLPPRDELAEPVFVQPRILEVPEVLPPPPALGGILIEPIEEVVSERRPGFELPLQAAPMSRRVLAAAVDGLLVFMAVGLFAYTFFRITSSVPALRQILLISAALLAVFWAGFQYLLLVYAGTTPGLKLARLRLSRFDGSPVPQTLRRWRVLASILAGGSLALGYAWCFFDEDQLCWHDRITHTYMAPQKPK